MNNRDLLFVDTETTGLDPTKHEVIEVSWTLTSPDAKIVKKKYLARMLPLHIETAEPKALEINGYTEVGWRTGTLTSQGEVAEAFHAVAKDKILVAHNVSFDEGFMTALLRESEFAPSWHYHKVDTAALAWPAFAGGALSGVSLEKVCAFLGIKQERKHAADADVESCRLVYLALMSRYAGLFMPA